MPDNRIKILYLIDELQPAGTEKQLVLLAENLCRDEFDPVIGVLRSTSYQTRLQIRTRIVDFCRKGPPLLKNLPVLRRLREFLCKEGVSLVQTQLVDSAVLGALAVRLSRPRPVLVATRRNAYHLKEADSLGFHLNRFAALQAQAVVANSMCAAEQCSQLEGIPREKIRVIENGIDLERFGCLSTKDAKLKFGLAGIYPVIGVVANWRPIKGLIHFLEAAALVRRELPSAHFVLAGQGPQKAELRERVRGLGLAEQVHFLEGISEVADVMAAFDIAVQCSLSESLSNVLIEYMAAGKPTVATRVGDAERVISDGATGLLVASGDPTALCTAVISLVRNPELAGEMGKLARAEMERNWSLAKISSRYQLLYKELLAPMFRSCCD